MADNPGVVTNIYLNNSQPHNAKIGQTSLTIKHVDMNDARMVFFSFLQLLLQVNPLDLLQGAGVGESRPSLGFLQSLPQASFSAFAAVVVFTGAVGWKRKDELK